LSKILPLSGDLTAPLAAQSSTIPKWVLSTLLPSGTGMTLLDGLVPTNCPLGCIWIGQPNNPVTFQATGLDKGILMEMFLNGYPVNFQYRQGLRSATRRFSMALKSLKFRERMLSGSRRLVPRGEK
jgi:hypothetical protein